jgi:hypothetical protein
MTLHLLPSIPVVASSPLAFAEEPSAHLIAGKKDIKSEGCPACLRGIKWSEFVHCSVDIHLENAHRAAAEDKTTSLVFLAAGARIVRHLG